MDKKWIFEGEEVCTESGIRICLNEGKLKVISADMKEEAHFYEDGKYFSRFPYKTEEQRASENKQRIFNNFFYKIGEEERKKISELIDYKSALGYEQLDFMRKVDRALANIKEDFWISTIEPTIKDDKLFFGREEECTTAFCVNEWMDKVQAFAPEFNSRLASEEELLLFYAYRVVKGYWSLYYICYDSSSESNYKDSLRHSGKCNLTGVEKVGGFNDGVGNTCKIVMKNDLEPCLYGGHCQTSGKASPVMSLETIYNYDRAIKYATPVIVCTDVKGDLIIQK